MKQALTVAGISLVAAALVIANAMTFDNLLAQIIITHGATFAVGYILGREGEAIDRLITAVDAHARRAGNG